MVGEITFANPDKKAAFVDRVLAESKAQIDQLVQEHVADSGNKVTLEEAYKLINSNPIVIKEIVEENVEEFRPDKGVSSDFVKQTIDRNL